MICLPDPDGIEFDEFLMAPPGMSQEQALDTVNAILEQVKDEDKDEAADWEDVKVKLMPLGFRAVSVLSANEWC